MEHFFSPNCGEDQKQKKMFTRNGTLFLSTDLRSDAHQSQIIGRDADEDHTHIVGGYTVKLLGGYIPPFSPCFGTTEQIYALRLFLLITVPLHTNTPGLFWFRLASLMQLAQPI